MQSQQGESDENADACQHVGERFVGLVPIYDESPAKNEGGSQCDKQEAPSLRQSLPARKHALPSPDVSHGAKHDRNNAEENKTRPMQSLNVHAHGRKKRRKNERSEDQRPPLG